MNIYMDYNARALLRPEAEAAMRSAMKAHGNPSSPHREGRAARNIIDEARERVAALCGVSSENVIFTSGGTEANALALNMAIKNDAALFVSAIEHPSILNQVRHQHRVIPVNASGLIEPQQVAQMIENINKPFVSVMLANNETGIIQPIKEIAALVRQQNGFIHCDGVQAAGKMNIKIKELGVDALSLSAHKMGGPPGAGALVLAENAHRDFAFAPMLRGGGQEYGQRAGTENLIAIAGFGAVAQMDQSFPALGIWRDELEASLPDDAVIFGQDMPRLANTSCFALPEITAQAALIMFDLAGISLSAGAACSSGKITPSHVLRAQNVSDDLAASALRVSLGWQTQHDDIKKFTQTLHRINNKQAA